jgi:hypothetical protein
VTTHERDDDDDGACGVGVVPIEDVHTDSGSVV